MLNRRQLLQGAGAVAVVHSPIAQMAQTLGFLPSAEAQTPNPTQDENKVYKSGEKIRTIVGDFEVDGWTIRYPARAIEDFETKNQGHKASHMFYSNLDEGVSYVVSGDFSKDLLKGIEARIFLPTDYHRKVFLEVTDNEKTDIYRIVLEPHFSPNVSGIVSEIALEESVLRMLSEQASSFNIRGQFFINDPYPIYVLKRDSPRAAYVDLEQRHIEIPSVVLTNPRFETEAQMLLFDALATQLSIRNSMSQNQGPQIQLFESYLRLIDPLGFKPIWEHRNILENAQQRKTHLLNGEAEKEAEKNPNFAIFYAPSYVPNGQASDILLTAPYMGSIGLFAAAITTFRFFPKEFIARYNNDPAIKKELVNPVANAVLNALEARMLHPDDTSVVIRSRKRDEDILKLIPALYELRSALSKR